MVRDETLELSDSLTDVTGLSIKQKTIYSLQDPKPIQAAKNNPDSYYECFIVRDPLKVNHFRSVYTYFDLFGDVGGL